jgi:type VI protein secretion system component VasK
MRGRTCMIVALLAALALSVSACGAGHSSNTDGTAEVDQASTAYLKKHPEVAKTKTDLEQAFDRCLGSMGVVHVYRDVRHNSGQQLEECMGLPSNVNDMFQTTLNQELKSRGLPHSKAGAKAFMDAVVTQFAIKLDKASKSTSTHHKKEKKS